MKEYTYTNKAYLGIKEGVVPPAPQYLWLNSKDDKLYKFGDNGWEVTNNASYVVEEFTFRDLVSLASQTNPVLTISRDFLDAMYKGVPIMVKIFPNDGATIPIIVDVIDNPSQDTTFQFRVTQNNKTLLVRYYDQTTITGNKALEVHIMSFNLVDWNENEENNTGYIANKTHHLGYRTFPVHVGQRVSLVGTKGTHYIGNYKLLYDGKLYDLPKTSGSTVDIANYFRVIFNDYSENGKTSTYTLATTPLAQTLPSQTFVICKDTEENGHKTLDEFYLPDGAKPWKRVIATTTERGAFIFDDIKDADIAGGVNVVRNKAIYYTKGKGEIIINPLATTSVLEFKILAEGAQNISISGEYAWENGGKPATTAANEVIYSFLVLEGKAYVSAKVF